MTEVMSTCRCGVPQHMVFCYTEAAATRLTNPALDPYGKIPEFKFCAAKVMPAHPLSTAEQAP